MRGSRFHRTAFTLIELVLVIGVLMLLLALLLPSLGKSMEKGKLTRRLSLVRQDVALIALYSADHAEVYPIASPKVNAAGLDWWQALVESGHIGGPADIDPQGVSNLGWVTIAMSTCVLYDPARMRPGQTEPINMALSIPVRQSQVAFPSAKGLLFQWAPPDGPADPKDWSDGLSWCCNEKSAASPVALCDGSAAAMVWRDFVLAYDGLMEGWVGHPVWSTWDGYLGRDR